MITKTSNIELTYEQERFRAGCIGLRLEQTTKGNYLLFKGEQYMFIRTLEKVNLTISRYINNDKI